MRSNINNINDKKNMNKNSLGANNLGNNNNNNKDMIINKKFVLTASTSTQNINLALNNYKIGVKVLSSFNQKYNNKNNNNQDINGNNNRKETEEI
jgi:hypothetical protein